MTRHMTLIGIFLWPVALSVTFPARSSAISDDHNTNYDCGTLALQLLLRSEGLTSALPAIEQALPPPRSDGYSMLELRDAARACGLRLVGVKLPGGTKAPDRPALVFLARGEHGHYAAIRPVGHTGKLVQVLDPNEEPVVLDAAELYASPEWTGLALVPARSNAMIRMAVVVAATALALTVAGWIVRRHSFRPVPSVVADTSLPALRA